MSGQKNDVTYAATVAFAVAQMRELGWMPPSNTSTDPPQGDLIERLRAVKWEVTDDCGRMPDDPTHECVFVDMRPAEFEALLTEAAAALEAAREDGWQPIETAPKPDIGTNGFGKRLLLVVDCGDGTIPSVRRGYWEGTDWYLDCCNGLATACGYRVTHWRPLPEPPAIDQARVERDALAHGGEE